MKISGPEYPAAYSAVSPSHDPEIEQLHEWLSTASPKAPLLIVAPDLNSLQQSAVAGQLLKRSAVESRTKKQLSHGAPHRAAVLALWPDNELLARVERLRPAAVATATWLPADVRMWAASRAALDVVTGEVAGPPELDPFVQAGVETIVLLSNPANGLNSYNKGWAVSVLKKLRDQGATWDSYEVGAFVAASGWGPRRR